MAKLSVVINTRNEEGNLPKAIDSVKNLTDEIVIVDMESEDGTVEIAKRLGAKVYSHKNVGYVEPARNFALRQAQGDWVLILDADEEIPESLLKILKNIIHPRGVHLNTSGVSFGSPEVTYYRIPRKNIIFGKWMKHTLWWPDYQIRLFKRGFVSWGDEIHSLPITRGKGFDLPAKENFAITHHNYNFLDQYIERLFKYTKIQAEEMMKNGYVFAWSDVVRKPLNEFLRRFFEGKGYKDGIHGLVLSLLQSFSGFVVYVRVWEKQGFKEAEIGKGELAKEFGGVIKDLKWWIRKELSWLKFLMSR